MGKIAGGPSSPTGAGGKATSPRTWSPAGSNANAIPTSEVKVDYEKLKQDVVAAHERLKKNPEIFIKIIQEQIKHFEADGKTLAMPGKMRLRTKEGVNAWNEAVLELQRLDSKNSKTDSFVYVRSKLAIILSISWVQQKYMISKKIRHFSSLF